MTVETRVIIDANAQNAIREIGKLDDAAGDADDTLNKLDGTTVDVDTSGGVDGMDELRRKGDEAIESVKALSRTPATIDVDTSDVATAAGDVDALQADAGTAITIPIDIDADKLDTAKKKLDDVGESAGLGSTAIGGIGGSISELPGIGSLGPIAESLGQLSENALEGGENIASIASSIGVLGGVAVVMKGIQTVMQNIADTKAFNEAQVESFKNALKETDSAAAAVLKTIEDAGGIEGRASKFGGLIESTKDITQVLIDAKIPAEDYIKAVTPGPEAAAANKAVTDELKAQRDALDTGTDAQIRNADEWEKNKKKQEELDATIEIVSETLRNNTDAVDKSTAAQGYLQGAQDDVKAAADNQKAALDRQTAGLEGATTAADNLRLANEKLRGDLSKRDAYLNLLDSFDDLKVKGKEAWDAAATGSADAETKARDYEQAQIDVKNQVIDYTEAIGDVPISKTTSLLADVDSGQIDTLKTDLNTLTSKTHKVNIDVKYTSIFNTPAEQNVFQRINGGRP